MKLKTALVTEILESHHYFMQSVMFHTELAIFVIVQKVILNPPQVRRISHQ